MSELLSCPFCGGSKLYGTSNGIGSSYIECEDCGACGPNSEGEESDGELWNRRPDPAPVGVRVPDGMTFENVPVETSIDYARGWNACRNKTLRLNPQPGAAVGEEISDAMLKAGVSAIRDCAKLNMTPEKAFPLIWRAALRTLTNTDKGAV